MAQRSQLETKLRPTITPLFGLFVIGLFVCASVAFFFSYTNNISGTPDFFVEWTATRVSLEGKNPYSRETTELIQMGSKGRLVGADEDQLAFATPYYRIFFSIPIAYLPYPAASAIWLGFMLALYIGATYLVTQAIAYRPTTPLEGTLLYLAVIFNFPAFSSLMLGQAALLSAAFLGWAYFAMKRDLTLLAGIFTALATVKP
jgi:Glycosyltransferase family 87